VVRALALASAAVDTAAGKMEKPAAMGAFSFRGSPVQREKAALTGALKRLHSDHQRR